MTLAVNAKGTATITVAQMASLSFLLIISNLPSSSRVESQQHLTLRLSLITGLWRFAPKQSGSPGARLLGLDVRGKVLPCGRGLKDSVHSRLGTRELCVGD